MESYRQVDPLVRFANSWTLVEVPPDELTIAGRLMGDCLADPANHHMIRRLLSLRDPNGFPKAMADVDEYGVRAHSRRTLQRELAADHRAMFDHAFQALEMPPFQAPQLAGEDIIPRSGLGFDAWPAAL